MTDVKNCGQPSIEKPHYRMSEQIRFLDRALDSITEWSDEGAEARRYLVAQIDALKWAQRLLET